MKKLLALSMAAMMALGMTSAINAAEKDTTDIDTTKTEDKQEGEVWGSITDQELQQLKVTMPIKIEYVISKGDDANGPNKMTVGDYKIVVSSDSQTGVRLKNVKMKQALDSEWTLDPNAADDTTDIHKVNIEIAGSKMIDGQEIKPTGDFTVDVNKSRSLDIKGNGSMVEITDQTAEASNLAFDIVYTIEQYTPAP